MTKEQLNKFINDPEWCLIEELLMDYFKPIIELKSIDLNQEAGAIKAEVRVRQEMFDKFKLFLNEVGLLKTIINREQTKYN